MTKPTWKQIRDEEEPWEIVTEETLGTSKWGTHERTIVKHPETGKLYATDYEQTPQDGRNYFEEVYEVRAVEKTVIEYEEVREAS